jgi:hypothetical protein
VPHPDGGSSRTWPLASMPRGARWITAIVSRPRPAAERELRPAAISARATCISRRRPSPVTYPVIQDARVSLVEGQPEQAASASRRLALLLAFGYREPLLTLSLCSRRSRAFSVRTSSAGLLISITQSRPYLGSRCSSCSSPRARSAGLEARAVATGASSGFAACVDGGDQLGERCEERDLAAGDRVQPARAVALQVEQAGVAEDLQVVRDRRL